MAVSVQSLISGTYKVLDQLGNWMGKMDLLETIAERTNMILSHRLLDRGKFDGTFCSNTGLVFLKFLFFLPSCLYARVNESQ